MANNNYISLYGAVNVNGIPINFQQTPLTEDMPAQQLVYVQLTNCLNAAGASVPAFMLIFQSSGLTTYKVYLYTYTGFQTIQQFLNGLATLGTGPTFTQYVNLLSQDGITPTVANQSILINDAFVVVKGRYLTNSNTTVVSVKWANKLVPTKFVFNGNQTTSGSYIYFYV